VSRGQVSAIPFDGMHRNEILLTILQSLLGMVLLVNMRYSMAEAGTLFGLWFVQFVLPEARETLLWVYGALIVIGLAQVLSGRRTLDAFKVFARLWRERLFPTPARG
jgi:hypothetical protein